MGGTSEDLPQAYAQANVSAPQTTAVLLHGSADAIVPLDQAEVSGIAAQFVADAGHFDWVHVETPAYQTLLSTINRLLPN